MVQSHYTHIIDKKPSECFFATRIYLADEVDAYIKQLLRNVTQKGQNGSNGGSEQSSRPARNSS